LTLAISSIKPKRVFISISIKTTFNVSA